MKNIAYLISYLGDKFLAPELEDIDEALTDLADEGILQTDTQKTKKGVSFIVSYLGDLPPKISELKKALKELKQKAIIKKIKPIYEVCDYCRGTGNEGTMDYIDCGNCYGSGWIKTEMVE